jgi:hypothetical protein
MRTRTCSLVRFVHDLLKKFNIYTDYHFAQHSTEGMPETDFPYLSISAEDPSDISGYSN